MLSVIGPNKACYNIRHALVEGAVLVHPPPERATGATSSMAERRGMHAEVVDVCFYRCGGGGIEHECRKQTTHGRQAAQSAPSQRMFVITQNTSSTVTARTIWKIESARSRASFAWPSPMPMPHDCTNASAAFGPSRLLMSLPSAHIEMVVSMQAIQAASNRRL